MRSKLAIAVLVVSTGSLFAAAATGVVSFKDAAKLKTWDAWDNSLGDCPHRRKVIEIG